jgi:hypothetical protein
VEKEIINRIRNNKRKLYKVYNLIKSEVDFETEMINSDSLLLLGLISKINEDLTDIIYMILDNKNS